MNESNLAATASCAKSSMTEAPVGAGSAVQDGFEPWAGRVGGSAAMQLSTAPVYHRKRGIGWNRNRQLAYSVGVTYRDFAALAKLAGWTVEELAIEFPGINAPTERAPEHFARVLKGQPDWNCIIPFRRLIDKYLITAAALMASGKLRACQCNCGVPLLDGRRQPEHPVVWRNGLAKREYAPPLRVSRHRTHSDTPIDDF